MNQLSIGNWPHPDYFVQTEIDRLRVNVGFAGADKKVIMVTSTFPNEGKSYIAVNLWNELSKSGKSVCFIDADMRKSNHRTTLRLTTNAEKFYGLSHYLAGHARAEEVIYSTEREKTYFIPTSTLVNPSILFEGKRFETLLQSLRNSFDYVIVDTPPLGLVSDGLMIAGKCDGAVLVVHAGTTSRRNVRESLMQLSSADCPLIGIVLNRVIEKKGKKGYGSNTYYSYRENPGKEHSSREGSSQQKG